MHMCNTCRKHAPFMKIAAVIYLTTGTVPSGSLEWVELSHKTNFEASDVLVTGCSCAHNLDFCESTAVEQQNKAIFCGLPNQQ